MIKKNKKKAIVASSAITTIAAVSALPIISLTQGANFKLQNNEQTRADVIYGLNNVKLNSLSYFPVRWNNTLIRPLDAQRYEVTSIKDNFRWRNENDTYNYSFIINPGNTSSAYISLTRHPMAPTNIPRDRNNFTMSTIPLGNLYDSGGAYYYPNPSNWFSAISSGYYVENSTLGGRFHRWSSVSQNATSDYYYNSSSLDRVIRIVWRLESPWGVMANNVFGREQIVRTRTNNGFIPQLYGTSNGGVLTSDPRFDYNYIDHHDRRTATLSQELILYKTISGAWNFLPKYNGSVRAKSINPITSSFDKTLPAEQALQKVIRNNLGLLTVDTDNAPLFWNETTRITTSYNNEEGTIKIKLYQPSTIEYEGLNYIVRSGESLNPDPFKSQTNLVNGSTAGIIKTTNPIDKTITVSGFKVINTPYLTEKSGANKNILPSTITNANAGNYVNVNWPSSQQFSPRFEVQSYNDQKGTLVISLLKESTGKLEAVATLEIKDFLTNNTPLEVTDPVMVSRLSGLENTSSVKQYKKGAIELPPSSSFTEASFLRQLTLNLNGDIPPLNVPYDNGIVLTSTNIALNTTDKTNYISLVSREGEIISSIPFERTNGTTTVINLNYDNVKNRVFVWYLDSTQNLFLKQVQIGNKGKLTVVPSTSTNQNPLLIKKFTKRTRKHLEQGLNIVKIKNLENEFWVFNRALNVRDLSWNSPEKISFSKSNNTAYDEHGFIRVKVNYTNASSVVESSVINNSYFLDRFIDATVGRNINGISINTNSHLFLFNAGATFINGKEYLVLDGFLNSSTSSYELTRFLLEFIPTGNPTLPSTSTVFNKQFNLSCLRVVRHDKTDGINLWNNYLITTPNIGISYNTIKNNSEFTFDKSDGWLSVSSIYGAEGNWNTTFYSDQFPLYKESKIVSSPLVKVSLSSQDFSIPAYGRINSSQQPYFEEGTTKLILRNYGGSWGSTSLGAKATGDKFKAFQRSDDFGSGSFTSQELASITQTGPRGYYNSYSYAKDSAKNDISSIIYFSDDANVAINETANLLSTNGVSNVRIFTKKNGNKYDLDTKIISTTIDAENRIDFFDIQNKSEAFMNLIKSSPIFSEFPTEGKNQNIALVTLKEPEAINTSKTRAKGTYTIKNYYTNGFFNTDNFEKAGREITFNNLKLVSSIDISSKKSYELLKFKSGQGQFSTFIDSTNTSKSVGILVDTSFDDKSLNDALIAGGSTPSDYAGIIKTNFALKWRIKDYITNTFIGPNSTKEWFTAEEIKNWSTTLISPIKNKNIKIDFKLELINPDSGTTDTIKGRKYNWDKSETIAYDYPITQENGTFEAPLITMYSSSTKPKFYFLGRLDYTKEQIGLKALGTSKTKVSISIPNRDIVSNMLNKAVGFLKLMQEGKKPSDSSTPSILISLKSLLDGKEVVTDLTQIIPSSSTTNNIQVYFLPQNSSTNIPFEAKIDFSNLTENGFSQVVSVPIEIDIPTSIMNSIKISYNTRNISISDSSQVAAMNNLPNGNKLIIEYKIGANEGIALDKANPTKKWFNKADFITFLKKYSDDNIAIQPSDKTISTRFALAPGESENNFIIKNTASVEQDTSSLVTYVNLMTNNGIWSSIKDGKGFKFLNSSGKPSLSTSDIAKIETPISNAILQQLYTNQILVQFSISKTAQENDAFDSPNWPYTINNPVPSYPNDLGQPPILKMRLISSDSSKSLMSSTILLDNTISVTPIIDIDLSSIKTNINLSSTDLQKIKLSGDIKNLEIDETGITNLNLYNSILEIVYSIGYDFENKIDSTTAFYKKETLIANLKLLSQDPTKSPFWALEKVEVISGTYKKFEINSTFKFKNDADKDKYVFNNSTTPPEYKFKQPDLINVSNNVNLQTLNTYLKNGKILFGESDNENHITEVNLPADILTYKPLLKSLGITLKYSFGKKATGPTTSDFTSDWDTNFVTNPEDLGNDPKNQVLYLSFFKIADNVPVVLQSVEIIEKKAPSIVIPKFLSLSKDNLAKILLSGNTKDLVIDQDNALVSSSNDPSQNQLVKENVDILYNIDNLVLDTTSTTNQQWYTKEELNIILPQYIKNITTTNLNNVKVKYQVKPSSDYRISDVGEHTFTSTQINPVKSYIHIKKYYDLLLVQGINVSGTTTANIGTITFPFEKTEFDVLLALGIELQWTTNQSASTDDQWTKYDFNDPSTHPKNIGWNPPYLAFRITVDPSFPRVVINPSLDKKAIPMQIKSPLKWELDLGSKNLSEIIFGGNTKDLTIDETKIQDFVTYESFVTLEYSIGWNFITNKPTTSVDERFYSKAELINNLKNATKWMIINRDGYASTFESNFKLKARFKIKDGIANKDNYVFNDGKNIVTKEYSTKETESISNYINLSLSPPEINILQVLTTGTIRFGSKDKLDSITEVNLPSRITPKLQAYLTELGVSLQYAFGDANKDPQDSDFVTTWNTDFKNNPQAFTSATPALYLKFVLQSNQSSLTTLSPSNIIKKVEPQIVIPKFIDLDINNLNKIVLTGTTINLLINQDEALVTKDPNFNQLAKDHIEIIYSINGITLDSTNPSEKWFTAAQLGSLLPNYTQNIFVSDLENIQANYRVKESSSEWSIDDLSPIKIDGAQVKSYLHVKQYYDALLTSKIQVSGTTTANIGTITFPFEINSTTFQLLLTNGIQFQWTTNSAATNDNQWTKYDFNDTTTHPTDIGWNPPYLAFRITVDPSFPRVVIDPAVDKVAIDVTPQNIKIFLNLNTNDLNQVVLGGSAKNLTIDETKVANLVTYSSLVEIVYSIGWDFDKNIASTTTFYTKDVLIAKLAASKTQQIISRPTYPTDFPNTFIFKSKFVLKDSVLNKDKYIIGNGNELKEYSKDELLVVKNYIDLSILQNELKTSQITFGANDKPNNVTEISIVAITDEIKAYLNILGIELQFAFGDTEPPVYNYNWNDPFFPPADPGPNLTVWLKFVVKTSSSSLTEINDPNWEHKAQSPQVVKPKYIELSSDNLLKTLLTGTTINLGIDESASLVPVRPEDQQDVIDHIEITYNINNIKFDSNNPVKIWFTKQELSQILPTYLENIFVSDLDNIQARYQTKKGSEEYKIPSLTPVKLNADQVKSYLHTIKYFESLRDNRVEIDGTAEDVKEIIFPASFNKTNFKILQDNGLVLQWTINRNPISDNDWKDFVFDDPSTHPKSIGINPYLGMRIVVSPAKVSRVVISDKVDNVVIDVTPRNIKVVYTVDSLVLETNLIPQGNTKKIKDMDETTSLQGTYPNYEFLDIQYQIGTLRAIEFEPGKAWYSFTDLQKNLLNYSNPITPDDYQIKARYVLKPGTPQAKNDVNIIYEIKFVGENMANLKMNNFKSFIDVTQALENLKNNKTLFGPNDHTDHITEITKTGLTDQESNLLFGSSLQLKAQLATELNATNFDRYWWQPGKNSNLPASLPNKDANGKPVLMWRFALTTINSITFDVDDNANVYSNVVQVNVQLPIQIIIDQGTDFETIKTNINGNTKFLILEEAINLAAIQNVKTKNGLAPEIPLELQYAIGGGTSNDGIAIDPNNLTKTWFNLKEFKSLLETKTIDFDTNQIRARFFIDPNYVDSQGQSYNLSFASPVTIQDKTLEETAKVKIFINKAEYENLPSQVDVAGSSDEIRYVIPNGLLASPDGTLSPGLELVWSIQDNPKLSEITQTDNDIWTSIKPIALNPVTKKLSMAYRVKPGYFLENSAKQVYVIDTTNIFVFVEVKNAWLDEISFTGNMINATIDEIPLQAHLTPLVGGSAIEIQYTIDEKEWLTKDSFIAKITSLAGAQDTNNFILLKSKIKARYSIKEQEAANYRLKVDGTSFIDTPAVTDPNLFRPILLAGVNKSFKGYINLDLTPEFVPATFKIVGTNSDPILDILQNFKEKLENRFMPYRDQGITPFDIYYTTNKGTGEGQYTFDEKHKIFGEQGFKTRGFDPITQELNQQFFGIKFVARNEYVVAKNNNILPDGYNFSLKLDIKTIVDSPFTGPIIAQFYSETKEKYYQGKGSLTLWNNSSLTAQLASSILDTYHSGDLANQYNIQYHVSDFLYDSIELEKVKNNPDLWTTIVPQNLKVGQYVLARIRMKEDSKFEIKDIQKSDTNQTKVVNLLVAQNKIIIQEPELLNRTNVGLKDLVDGDVYIEKASMGKDVDSNYLGVDLTLEVNTEFYKKNGQILIDRNGLPIVKRQPTSDYVIIPNLEADNGDGASGKEVRIYFDNNKIPTAPITLSTWTDLSLTEIGPGSFTYKALTNDNFRGLMFNNQTFRINIKVKNDFILDSSVLNIFSKTITNAKYPINLTNINNVNIAYTETVANIQYASIGSDRPINGAAFIKDTSEVKILFNYLDKPQAILSGNAAKEELKNISNGKLVVQLKLKRKDGSTTIVDDSVNLSQFSDLSNGDRISISIVSSDPKFVWFGSANETVIIVKGLTIPSPNVDLFKDLQIVTNVGKENIKNGFGTFFVSIKLDGGEPPVDLTSKEIPGFQFVYRVWSKDKKVKIDWTPDSTKLTGLSNGEKIEWRLVEVSGTPIATEYYNTIAYPGGKDGFAVVNRNSNGVYEYDKAIGNGNIYQNDEVYPENQGFTVSDLIETEQEIIITEEEKQYIVNNINISFSGTNGTGIFVINNGLVEQLEKQGIQIIWYKNGQESERLTPEQTSAMLSNGETISYILKGLDGKVILNPFGNNFIVEGLDESSNFTTTVAIVIASSIGLLTLLIIIGTVTYKKLIKDKLDGSRSKRK